MRGNRDLLLCLEIKISILWMATGADEHVLSEPGLEVGKVGLKVDCLELLGELLECRGQPVIGLVARCPKRIAAGVLWDLDELQDGIVGRDLFKGGTAEPGRSISSCTMTMCRTDGGLIPRQLTPSASRDWRACEIQACPCSSPGRPPAQAP